MNNQLLVLLLAKLLYFKSSFQPFAFLENKWSSIENAAQLKARCWLCNKIKISGFSNLIYVMLTREANQNVKKKHRVKLGISVICILVNRPSQLLAESYGFTNAFELELLLEHLWPHRKHSLHFPPFPGIRIFESQIMNEVYFRGRLWNGKELPWAKFNEIYVLCRKKNRRIFRALFIRTLPHPLPFPGLEGASVTKLAIYWNFGKFSKLVCSNKFAQISHILKQFLWSL